MGCVTSGIQSQSFLGIQSVKMENIISSLLNIKELMEDTLQRFDVVQQHLDDFRASHDKMHQIFQLSLDELEDQICEIQEEDAVAVEEDEAKGKIKSAQLTLSDVPKNPKPFPSFSDLPVRTSCHSLHLRNYFSFFSFRSIVPSTNDTVTVKEEDLAIRWKFDPGGIHIQSLDSSPSPQNNSHTIFQPVDLSYSHFSASIHTSLMIDWKWIDKGCSRWRWEQNTKRRVQMVTPKIIKMSLVADNSKSLAICHDSDIVCIFVVHWHQIEFIVSRIGLVQIASSFKTKCQTQHSKQPIKSFPKFAINGFSNNTLEEKGEQPVSSDEEEFEGMIQADFAFFNPRANDFHGVKTWLQTHPDHTAYYRGRFDLELEDMTRPPEHGEIAKLSQSRQQDVVALASGYLRLDQLLLFHKRGSEHEGKRTHVQILTAARDVWDGFFVQTWTEGMAPQMFDKILEQNLMLIFQLSSSIFVSLVSRFRAGFKVENQMVVWNCFIVEFSHIILWVWDCGDADGFKAKGLVGGLLQAFSFSDFLEVFNLKMDDDVHEGMGDLRDFPQKATRGWQPTAVIGEKDGRGKLIYGAVIQDVADPGVLITILICKHEGVSHISAQKAALHLNDILLLANFVLSSRSIRSFKYFSSNCHVEFSFGGDYLGDKFSIFVLHTNGSIYISCPVIPIGSFYTWVLGGIANIVKASEPSISGLGGQVYAIAMRMDKRRVKVLAIEYAPFYKSLTNNWEDYLAMKQSSVEGQFKFKAIRIVLNRTPFKCFNTWKKPNNVKLHVHLVFIMDNWEELISEYLGVAKGVVDSENLPLNNSREMLQLDQILKVFHRNLTMKCVDILFEIDESREARKPNRTLWTRCFEGEGFVTVLSMNSCGPKFIVGLGWLKHVVMLACDSFCYFVSKLISSWAIAHLPLLDF